MRSVPVLAVAAALAAVAVVSGGYILAGSRVDAPAGGDVLSTSVDTMAVVGTEVLGREEYLLAGGEGPGSVEAWMEDELLAQLAVERGLENPLMSGFAAGRARQLYLRDALVSSALAGVVPPGTDETMRLMQADPGLYMIERHYYEILVPDSSAAESLHARLGAGQSFPVMAENASLGQKAALGGDMGFLVGGELTGRGLPDAVGRLEGLSGVVGSDLGWHIFLVTETRPLTDTARVVASLQWVFLERQRRQVVLDLLEEARQGRACYSNEGTVR